MKKFTSFAMVAALSLAPLAFAQSDDQGGPPAAPSATQMMPHRITRLATLLNLTAAQQTQAATIFTEEATSNRELRSTMRTARKALQSAIQSNDAAAISTQANQIGTLTGQETEARAKAEAAFYAMLTPDQQAKYKLLRPFGPEAHGGPRFGGPGGRPPQPPAN